MPFCPNCGDEYRAGFGRCSDCDVELIEASAPEDDPPALYEQPKRFARSDYSEVEPVAVFRAPSQINAEIVLSALRAAGVRAYMAGTGLEAWTEAGGVGQITRVPGPLNDIRIMVHPEDEEDARGIIAQADGESVQDEMTRTALAASDPGEDGMGATEDSPHWRTDSVRNRGVVRTLAVFLLIPILITSLSALYRLFLYFVEG